MNKKRKRRMASIKCGWQVYKYSGKYYVFNVSWHWLAEHVGFNTKKAAWLWARQGCHIKHIPLIINVE